uniref:Autophagy related 2B n=1 Tax=Echeneis naucrates TaxID=173247 RepID=A0A665UX69_ECHNA
MPWPFSESIKKRACRYLLHRYLGNFLEEKLSMDQLSLDLYQGTGSLAQVPLDKWSLNELLETADAPFEVIAGFIQTISLTVPWAALLQENCALEVKGLEMVLRPRPRAASGIEPMYWSSFMTSSMQLAKECLSQKLTDDIGESFQPFEGLEKFAETIETVLRRVKVTFLDTVIRVEHIPENSKTGIALEIRINKIVYCDETGEESSSVNVHQPTTFAHKNLQMDGITVFWDEFSDVSRAGCKSSPTPTVGVANCKKKKIVVVVNGLLKHMFIPYFCMKLRLRRISCIFRDYTILYIIYIIVSAIISQHKAFTEVFLDDSHTPTNCHVSLTVNAPVLGLVVRFPIPDLRSDQERGPWFKKSLQKEVLYLELEDLEVKTEFMGGSSPNQTKMELTFRDVIGILTKKFPNYSSMVFNGRSLIYIFLFFISKGKFQEEPDQPAAQFLRVSHTMDGDMTTSEKGAAHSLKDVCDFGKPEPSPFSSRRVMYENEEMVIPGDVAEMTEFQEKTMNNSRFILELCFPNVQLALPSKSFYEKLHNRINNDLLLWEPTAPSPVETVESMPYGVGLSVASQLINTYSKDNFSQFRSTGPDGEAPKTQSKNSQSLFSVILSVNHGLVALQTNKEDKTVLKNKHGEFWMEVKNTVLFSVTQYEGYKDQHYICFHTSSICMYHQGKQTALINYKFMLFMLGATLQHRVVPPSLGWYDQIVDFLNVSDEPVLGYAPPTYVTTLHLHLWSCSLDYRPLHLPLRSLLIVETFSISSSVSLDHSSSTLRIILDEAALFLSDKSNAVSVNLARDYVQVVDMGTLELRITAVKPGVDGKLSEPRFELRCSSDVIHIRTCSDSCAALMNLIQYVASYGDLLPTGEPEAKASSTTQRTKVSSENPSLYILHLADFLTFPSPAGAHEDTIVMTFFLSFFFNDFLYHPFQDRDQEPMVKQLTSDPVQIKDDHFSQPVDGSDSSRGAVNFPIPEVRYLIKEISVIWHLYGGKDFGSATFTASPARSRGSTPYSSPSQTPVRQAKVSGRAGGGKGRNPDVLMEIQLSKLRFQHEVYPQAQVASGSAVDQPVSRQVFIVQDLEIRDRLATSQMNKFLYLYSSKEMPRKAHSNMLTVKALHMCPESGQAPQECCLRVSLMPLRLNIDQDALFFLKDFFTSLTTESHRQPLLEFRFTSEVPIRLDYHGKHVSMEQGTFAGIIIGLTQLNCSELKLRRLCYRQGLLGMDKLFSYAINEWLSDIKKNQLPGLLGGVGPIHSLVQLVQGFRDLVWLPIEQYRKDGRIVRGFQRGTASFGTSTAMAALELTNRMVRTIQAAAETAYDMVSPVPDEKDTKRIKRFTHYGLAHQPVDLREGVAKAYTVVKEGITDTALTIYDTATREHEQRGMTGAVGGVLRQLPPAVVKPLIMATEATSNVLGGMRNQIHPDARQEESQKWRQGEE